MPIDPAKRARRGLDQIREHYEIEKELANRLRRASREDRRRLYVSLYDELYRRVPRHAQHLQKSSPEETVKAVAKQMGFLRRFLSTDTVFLEVGPGDCSVSLEAAGFVKRVYAVDVSREISRRNEPPRNFQFVLFDGCSLPLLANSVDVAYSNQVVEHLHPEDAFEQLRSIHEALVPDGLYVCVTPNRVGGPHDISGHFDRVAAGFHLHEYSSGELQHLLRRVGFSRVMAYAGARGRFFVVPLRLISLCERLLSMLPHRLGRAFARFPFRPLLGIRMVAVK
jgi:SAM-dependent methyltransferase